jgi:hypothetical protein
VSAGARPRPHGAFDLDPAGEQQRRLHERVTFIGAGKLGLPDREQIICLLTERIPQGDSATASPSAVH